MEHYSFLRELADSWGLLAMTAMFIGVCLWVMRPKSRALHDEAANSIFRNDRAPAAAGPHSNRKEA
ncbi:MAG: cbb3-type cytochrome c oxidase subunit 3 [Paracoccaceae bacterium]